MDNNTLYPDSKIDAFRTTMEFTDLLRIVAGHYDMYSKAVEIVGPVISKQFGAMIFVPPNKEELDRQISGRGVASRTKSAFIDSLVNHLVKTKGKKALIYPSPTTHHSAQFPSGTFSISKVDNSAGKIELKDIKYPRAKQKILFKIELAGADAPLYVEKLPIPIDQINFLIIRPKLGKLGTSSVNKWEVLFYKKRYNYIVDHIDSTLNPRFAGIM